MYKRIPLERTADPKPKNAETGYQKELRRKSGSALSRYNIDLPDKTLLDRINKEKGKKGSK